ncbi:MAG: pimeloyl-ACP methyl esterase BioG family protein [Cetobacterium sp.]|uniref:pimeloyl-ACP methyl esterase BioG family protein n=1 Tax=Cetobacterium sp. TaxID=2071632 RepID=UPI003F38CADF
MNLILFFNGWGMDKDIFSNFSSLKNFHIEIISYPYIVPPIDFTKYNKIFIIGWSFGVYYASLFLKDFKYTYEAIAINGTPEVIGNYGITPKIFQLTLETLNQENLIKFYKNMEISDKIFFNKKDINFLANSLKDLGDNYTPQKNFFHRVIIAQRDKIIPTSRQIKYFEKEKVPIYIIPCGHYPFEFLDSWDKIIKDVNNEF